MVLADIWQISKKEFRSKILEIKLNSVIEK